MKDWIDILTECNRTIDECIDSLSDVEECFWDEDYIESAELHQLYDMAEDAAESARVRRAQMNLAWRH